MPLEPLALQLVSLRANVLPVAVGRVSLTYFLDQTGEVTQAGDRHGWLAVEHRDVFAGTAEPDGSLELFQRYLALIEILREALIGQRETGSDAGRREQHAPNLTHVVLMPGGFHAGLLKTHNAYITPNIPISMSPCVGGRETVRS